MPQYELLNEDDDLEAVSLFDDSLPSNHRSGFVAVIGRPNVGKSTLMNHFLGQKIAIVSPKPQTTRNQLLGILTLPDENYPDLPPAQVIFVDTPGIHRPHHKLGEYLVETALEAIPDAEVVVWLVDAFEPPHPEDRLVVEAIAESRAKVIQYGDAPPPVILALNKMDLLTSEQIAGVEKGFLELYPADDWLLLSATRGDYRNKLLERIVKALPPGPQITDYPA